MLVSSSGSAWSGNSAQGVVAAYRALGNPRPTTPGNPRLEAMQRQAQVCFFCLGLLAWFPGALLEPCCGRGKAGAPVIGVSQLAGKG